MRSRSKILIINPPHPYLIHALEALGFVCDFHTEASYDELKAIVPTYYGIIIKSRIKIDRTFLDAASHLKFIARIGAGLESIDVAYAEQKGIGVH